MSLTRVNSTLSQILVRRLGDAGGPRVDQVSAELDSLIAWAKLSPRCIHRDISTVGNVGAGLDVLHTFSLPANSLQANGDYLTVSYGGNSAANDTDKRVNAFFGGTAYENLPVLDIDGGAWAVQARIIRLSSTSVRVSSVFTWGAIHADNSTPVVVATFGGGYLSVTRNVDITGLSDLGANATTMEVKGEGAANNDVTQTLSIIELTQQ